MESDDGLSKDLGKELIGGAILLIVATVVAIVVVDPTVAPLIAALILLPTGIWLNRRGDIMKKWLPTHYVAVIRALAISLIVALVLAGVFGSLWRASVASGTAGPAAVAPTAVAGLVMTPTASATPAPTALPVGFLEEPMATYDFEEAALGWEVQPGPKGHVLERYVGTEYARSGRGSLRLEVDIQAYGGGESIEYGAVAKPNLNYANVQGATAWVLVPESDSAERAQLTAKLIGARYLEAGAPEPGSTEPGKKWRSIDGPDVPLVPGRWTKVFFGRVAGLDEVKWDGNLNGLTLSVRARAPYKGAIYLDDIVVLQ